MINFMVANFHQSSRHSKEDLIKLLDIQIHNSLDLGWNPKDIIIYSNFDYEYMGVKLQNVGELNDFCLTGSKMFGVKKLFESYESGCDEVVWAHDLDSWQDYYFNCPEFNDVGITRYSRPKVNGGSIFWKYEALDIINEVIGLLIKDKRNKEEPTLNEVVKRYPARVTLLNYTYNVGCSGYVPRYTRSIKPVHVYHFHPTNGIAWETHVLDRNGLGSKISDRLEKLIRQYYPNLALELSGKGKKRREERIKERQNESKKYYGE